MRTNPILTLCLLSLLAVLSLASCVRRVEPFSPVIAVDPTSGGPGTLVTVTGSGFPANTGVSTRIGPPNVGASPQSYADGITDSTGSVSLTFDMPSQWPDGLTIGEPNLVVVVLNEDGTAQATADFAFQPPMVAQPALTLIPGNAAPGEQIEVWGSGFQPNSEVALRLGTPNTGLSEENLAQILTDSQGQFQTLITIPSQWPGTSGPLPGGDLVIAAVDETLEQALATASFFNLVPAVPDLAPAGNCPIATPDTDLLIDRILGYCLLYPKGHSVLRPNESEAAIVVGSLLNVEPLVLINVQDAGSRSAQQVADQIVAEFASAMPGLELLPQEALVDGEPAMVLDEVPGQDLSRQVLVVHQGRLFKLTFIPVSSDNADIVQGLENLYATVMGSFVFLE